MKVFTLLIVILTACVLFGQTYHADMTSTAIHTPFRWIVADSAARVNLTVAARDTQKLCLQMSDTTIWLLLDNSPKVWKWISGNKTGIMPCTLKTSDVTVQQIANAYWTKNGNELTVQMPYMTGTSNSLNCPVYCRLPYFPITQYLSQGYTSSACRLTSGTNEVGFVNVSKGVTTQITFVRSGASVWETSGSKGFYPFSFKFITEN